MKRFFSFLGLLFLVLLIAGAVSIPFFRSRIVALDRQSRDYVAEAVPVVFSTWNPTELFSRASPEFQKATSFIQVYQILREASVLGRLEKYDPPQGGSRVFFLYRQGLVTSALFKTRAEFEHGEAEITLGLIKHGTQWQIHSFNVQSPDVARLTASPMRAPAAPPRTVSADEKRDAIARYPELGVAGSPLNVEFVARHKRYQKEQPDYFLNPSWPLRLADESARALKR